MSEAEDRRLRTIACELIQGIRECNEGFVKDRDWVASKLADAIKPYRERAERAEAAIANLPKTADGVPVTPNMKLYRPEGTGTAHWVGQAGVNVSPTDIDEIWCAAYCYSKLSLAIAAAEDREVAAAKLEASK